MLLTASQILVVTVKLHMLKGQVTFVGALSFLVSLKSVYAEISDLVKLDLGQFILKITCMTTHTLNTMRGVYSVMYLFYEVIFQIH